MPWLSGNAAWLSVSQPSKPYTPLLVRREPQVLPSAALSYYTYDTLKTVLGAR